MLAADDVEVLPGIRTMWLGGHSPCSQAIIVQTDRGKAVLTGDTVSLYANIERNIPVGVAYNYDECIEAMEKVKRVADMVLPSHDPEVLRRFPEEVIG